MNIHKLCLLSESLPPYLTSLCMGKFYLLPPKHIDFWQENDHVMHWQVQQSLEIAVDFQISMIFLFPKKLFSSSGYQASILTYHQGWTNI